MVIYTKIEQVSADFFKTAAKRTSPSDPGFRVYDKRCLDIFGQDPSLHLSLSSEQSIYHEACVFVPREHDDLLFITSNILVDETDKSKHIEISKLKRASKHCSSWIRELIPAGDIVMANGAVNDPTRGGVLFCAQGGSEAPSGLIHLDVREPHSTRWVLGHYHGRQFNSVNDVVFAKDGAIWFTDPCYGWEQGFKPQPELPNQVYRFDEKRGSLRVMADGFGKPNGLCFSPDEKTMYGTDTHWMRGDGVTDDMKVSHIYAFTVQNIAGAPFLTNRRVFAMADHGVPDGIKCDLKGNVYSGCGDGVNIWAPDGSLLGKIVIPGGVANFCFGRPGEMFLLNEKKFWVASIAKSCSGALLGL